MKQFGFTLMLFVIVLSPLAAVCQALPDSPQPAPDQGAAKPGIAERTWRHIQQIRYGEPIDVASTYGPPLRCRFSSATEDAIFCDAPNSPDGSGYRFDRAAVTYVEELAPPPKPNHHPVWLSSMIAGGILVGLAAAEDTDAGHAAALGALGAVIVGGIGAPMALLNQNNGSAPGPLIYGAQPILSVPIRKFRLRHAIFPIKR